MKSNKLIANFLTLAVIYCFYEGFVNNNKQIQEALSLAYWIISSLGIIFTALMLAAIPKVDELKKPMNNDPWEIWPYRALSLIYAVIFAYWGETGLAVAITMCSIMGAQMRAAYNKRYYELNPKKDQPTI